MYRKCSLEYGITREIPRPGPLNQQLAFKLVSATQCYVQCYVVSGDI